MKIRVALLQLLPGETLEEQHEAGLAACRKAKEMGADIALFPEMWSDGYRIPQDISELQSLAIEPDSAFIKGFSVVAVIIYAFPLIFLLSFPTYIRSFFRRPIRYG